MTRPETDYPRQRIAGPSRLLPLLGWFHDYRRPHLARDTAAGLTVAAVLVPQSMAYAALAGLPPSAGIHAAVVPLAAYAAVGSSGTVSIGPSAITAMVTASVLAPLADGSPGRYTVLAGALALLVGAVHLFLGATGLSSATRLLSRPVIAGFTAAAALIIAAGQIGPLLGAATERADALPGLIGETASAAGDVDAATVALAAGAVAALLALKRFAPRLPGALIVMITAATAAALIGPAVETIGAMDVGPPTPSVPLISAADLAALLPGALTVALVTAAESTATANTLGSRTGQEPVPRRELLGLGAANTAAGLFGAFPVSGGLSRSAVAHSAGARTPVASLVAAAAVLLLAIPLSPWLSGIPDAALAAIVVTAALGLVRPRSLFALARTGRPEALVLATAFAATLLLGAVPGLAIGVAASLGVLLWRATRPLVSASACECGGSTTLRVTGPLCFANRQKVREAVDGCVSARPGLNRIDLDLAAVPFIDADGAELLAGMRRSLGERGVSLRLSAADRSSERVLHRSGLGSLLAPAPPRTGLDAGEEEGKRA
ncbi:SulP family inorganic anion transporter [Salininema proteolyticum]|uniref:SulP family inorganic anion transporter n=1 Tax=Salininema proteolyticum TaxID=1607685 RepID=A0ABV8TWP0_9ACTN